MKNSGFKKVYGGYEKEINKNTKMFVPDMCVKSFDEATGEIEMHAPKYEEKEPAQPSKVGINAYQYETQEAPTDCDFELSIGHYGDNYLTPLKDIEIKGRVERCTIFGGSFNSNVWPASKLNLGKISSADRNYLETISADGYTGDIKATGSIVANSVKTSSGADLDTLNDSLANRKILSSIQYITISGTGQITDKSLDFEIPVGYSVLSSVDVAVKGSGYFTVTPVVTISNGKYYINKWYSLLNNTTSETIQSIVYFISNDHLENTP